MRFAFAILWLLTTPFVSAAHAVPVEIIYRGTASGYTNFSPYLCGYDCYFTNVPVLLTYWFNVPGGATSFSNSYVDTVAHPVPGFVYGTPTAGASLDLGGAGGIWPMPDQANSGGTPIPGSRTESLATSSGILTASIDQSLGYHQPGLYSISTSSAGPSSLTGSYAVTSGLGGSGYFGASIGDGGMYGTLALDAIYVNGGIAAFPEPSTWAMLLIGFAAIGFAGYRGRSQAAIVAVGAVQVGKEIAEVGCRCGRSDNHRFGDRSINLIGAARPPEQPYGFCREAACPAI
jgi:hypothetical protein